MTARDREADLIGHVRTHETCTPECEDFRRLLGVVNWRPRYCGCGWCCASTPPERRGETHQRTCRPKVGDVLRGMAAREVGDDE